MTGPTLEPYLARLGYGGSTAPTLEVLAGVHAAHVASIPFENLDPLLGRPVRLDGESLRAKLVDHRRGGYCYEHNLLLADALRAMGFEVVPLAARVVWGVADGVTSPRTHMLMMVEVAGQRFIADVGFGGMTLPAPLRLDEPRAQDTPHGRFKLDGAAGEHLLQVELGGQWQPMYRFDLQPQQRADYELTSWYLCHHPDSIFRRSLRVARIGAAGRMALLDNRLSIYPPGGEPRVSWLTSAAGLRETLEEGFGIDLGGLDGIDALLGQLAARTSVPD